MNGVNKSFGFVPVIFIIVCILVLVEYIQHVLKDAMFLPKTTWKDIPRQ